MTRRDLKKLPWLGITAILLQALALGLGFVVMSMGLQIGLMIGFLGLGVFLMGVEYYKDGKKNKERQSRALESILLLISALILISTLTLSLVLSMSAICAPVALGMTLLSLLVIGYKVEVIRSEIQHHKWLGDFDSDTDSVISQNNSTGVSNAKPNLGGRRVLGNAKPEPAEPEGEPLINRNRPVTGYGT